MARESNAPAAYRFLADMKTSRAARVQLRTGGKGLMP
jgi:hypothetical protein